MIYKDILRSLIVCDTFCFFIKTDKTMNNLKVLTIANFKGGCGVTTISKALVEYFSRQDYKVLVIDLCYRTDLFNRLFSKNTKDKNKELEFIADSNYSYDFNSASESLFLKSNIVHCEENVDALSVDEFRLMRASSNESTNSEMKDFIASISSEYDIVIIDTPPAINYSVCAAIECSTFVLIPVLASGGHEIDGAIKIINKCEIVNQKRSTDNLINISVFRNKYNKTHNIDKALLLYIQNDPLFSKYAVSLFISNWIAYKDILDKKESIFDTAEKKAREQLTEFCQFILEDLLSTSKY